MDELKEMLDGKTPPTCSSCPFWRDTQAERQAEGERDAVSEWPVTRLGQALRRWNKDTQGGAPRPQAKPGGDCTRMPTTEFKLPGDCCGEHPERAIRESIRRLAVSPGDVLVFRAAERNVSMEGAKRIRALVGDAFPGHRCVVLRAGDELSVAAADLRTSGTLSPDTGLPCFPRANGNTPVLCAAANRARMAQIWDDASAPPPAKAEEG